MQPECQCQLLGHRFEHTLERKLKQVMRLAPAVVRVVRRKRRSRRLEPIELLLRQECERDLEYIDAVTESYMSRLEPTGPRVKADQQAVTQMLRERRLAREQS